MTSDEERSVETFSVRQVIQLNNLKNSSLLMDIEDDLASDSQLERNQLDVFFNPTMLFLERISPKLDQFFLSTLDLLISCHMSLKLLMM